MNSKRLIIFLKLAVCVQVGHLSASTGYVKTVAGGGPSHQGGKHNCVDPAKLVDGIGKKARFSYPWGITYHKNTLYIGDCGCPENSKFKTNDKIRRIDLATGQVDTLAGSASGYEDGPGNKAQFYHVSGMAVDPAGQNMYVVDSGNSRIRKVNLKSGFVSTFAGGEKGYKDGAAELAMFRNPQAILYDEANDRMLVSDTDNHAIRILDPHYSTVTTLTGGNQGLENGHKKKAKFFHPTGLALDSSRHILFVADHYNHVIRMVNTINGKVATLAGGGRQGFKDGKGEHARFNYPEGIAYDPDTKMLYVVEFVREVSTLAGSYREGYLDGLGVAAQFYHPTGLTLDSRRKIIYVTDQYNHLVRSINAVGYVATDQNSSVAQFSGMQLLLIIIMICIMLFLMKSYSKHSIYRRFYNCINIFSLVKSNN